MKLQIIQREFVISNSLRAIEMSSSKHLTTIVLLLIIFHPPNSAHPGHVTADSTERIEILMPGLAPQVTNNLQAINYANYSYHHTLTFIGCNHNHNIYANS